tara:strand:+ start:189 stop:428 length:240 start_codon:yes stop_codon:yes gene_type:complete
MDNLKAFVARNKLNFSILIFVILFSIMHYLQPNIVYDDNGEFRPFGVGYKHKTIIPIWLVSIIFAIFSYLFIMSYLAYI